MNGLKEESQSTSQTKVFISYCIEDSPSAEKLYSDMEAASLNPWIDSENLLPGQNKKMETKKAIRESDYFIALLSKKSVKVRGDVTRQINTALDVIKEVPETVYFIPARLDNVDIPFQTLSDIQHVDMFPKWERGLKKILKVIGVNDELIDSVIKHQNNISPFALLDVSQKKIQTKIFKGEKQFFVGRQIYIKQIIRDKVVNPGSKVSIFGPGGSGKSQLAFKAMHQYVKEGIFDLVIPIYFDEGLIPFDKFLLQIAEIFGLRADEFETNTTIEQRKGIISELLQRKKHPLIYLDNFETVSSIINQKEESDNNEHQVATQIINFLNNDVPSDNTSILITSRERINNLPNEDFTDLEGLNIEDSMKLFNAFVRPEFKNLTGNAKNQIEKILKKTGGHPLTIEIIARNFRGIHQLASMLRDLFKMKGDPTQAEKRFQTLQACYDYTIKRLDKNLQELIPKLTLFKSPFPISAAVEIFDISKNKILELFDRSLLKLVNSDELYGNIENPQYWLYNFHPSVRGYVENMMVSNGPSLHTLETRYGEGFSKYYYNLLVDTYDSIGKETHRLSLAEFNLILQSGANDFQRAVELATDRQRSADILSYLGLLVSTLGVLPKALDYHKKALEIHEGLNDRSGMAKDYSNIGWVLRNMGNNQQALDYHKKALDIHKDLNNRGGMAGDYNNIGLVLSYIGNNQQALDYHNKALEIDIEQNDKHGIGRDYNNIGLVFLNMDNNQEALDYYKKALEIHEDLNERGRIALVYRNIGLVHSNMGNNQQALDYHKKALDIHKDLIDTVEMAGDYNNIGLVLSYMGNNQQALDYHNKALEIYEGQDDMDDIALVYRNIGLVHYGMDNNQEALDYHKKALDIHKDLIDAVGMAGDYNNIGMALKELNKHEEAVESIETGLTILLKLEKETGFHNRLIETLKETKESFGNPSK